MSQLSGPPSPQVGFTTIKGPHPQVTIAYPGQTFPTIHTTSSALEEAITDDFLKRRKALLAPKNLFSDLTRGLLRRSPRTYSNEVIFSPESLSFLSTLLNKHASSLRAEIEPNHEFVSEVSSAGGRYRAAFDKIKSDSIYVARIRRAVWGVKDTQKHLNEVKENGYAREQARLLQEAPELSMRARKRKALQAARASYAEAQKGLKIARQNFQTTKFQLLSEADAELAPNANTGLKASLDSLSQRALTRSAVFQLVRRTLDAAVQFKLLPESARSRKGYEGFGYIHNRAQLQDLTLKLFDLNEQGRLTTFLPPDPRR